MIRFTFSSAVFVIVSILWTSSFVSSFSDIGSGSTTARRRRQWIQRDDVAVIPTTSDIRSLYQSHHQRYRRRIKSNTNQRFASNGSDDGDDDDDETTDIMKGSGMATERRDFITSTVSTLFVVGSIIVHDRTPALAAVNEPVEDTLTKSSAGTMTPPTSAAAARGPIELLRPATRVRILIDTAVDTCRTILKEDSIDNARKGTNDAVDKTAQLQPLMDMLLTERSFLTPEESKLARRYLEIDTTTPWQTARLQERVQRGKERGIDYTTPYDRVNTAIQQWGDRRQFQLLQNRQRNLERNNEIRAAFNAYTNNIVFSDSYRLNLDGESKKALVRNDALPDVNAVVVSDLDLRDLYRNQILQNMDDAKSELTYQLKLDGRNGGNSNNNNRNSSDGDDVVDVTDLLDYLLAAQSACNEWFSFIPTDDVVAAKKAVLAGG